MSGIERNRYSNYTRRLHRIKGLFSNSLKNLRSINELPHPQDPRRERILHHLLELKCVLNEAPLAVLTEINYERQLRPLTVCFSHISPVLRPSSLPNTRDPRRTYACKRIGYSPWSIRSSSLVDNETFQLNESTCPVLSIDVSDWPNFKHSWIELIPNECNATRTALEIQFDQVEGFDSSRDEPMLEFDNDDLYVECVKTCYRDENVIYKKSKVIDTRSVTFIDLCDDDDVVMKDEQGENAKVSVQIAGTSLPNDIIILNDDDDDVQFVETYENFFTVVSMSRNNKKQQQSLSISDTNEAKNYKNYSQSLLRADCAVEQVRDHEISLNSLKILKIYTAEEKNENILKNVDKHNYTCNKTGALLFQNLGMKEDTTMIENYHNGIMLLPEKRKREISESPRKSLTSIEPKRRRQASEESYSDVKLQLRSCECRFNMPPRNQLQYMINMQDHPFYLLFQYYKNYNLTWSCMNYFFIRYWDLMLFQFIQVTNIVEKRKKFSWLRSNQKHENENFVFIEDFIETKGCDKIFSTKFPNFISKNEETNNLNKNYPLKKFGNIETTFLLNHLIPKPVTEDAVNNKSQDLQLNLVSPHNIKVFSNIKQNFHSTVSNLNHNKINDNIFDIQKFKKYSLSIDLIPQQYNCTKKFCLKSHDLSIKLTLKRDQLNRNNWIDLQNSKLPVKTSTKYSLENFNINKNYINQIIENSIIYSQNICDTVIKVCKLNTFSEKVPELEINDYENRFTAIKNINNSENSLSPYLKSVMKKGHSNFKDIINIKNNINNLYKWRKWSNNYIMNKIQKHININTNLGESSSKNDMQTKSLLRKLSNNYSKKLLPKIGPSILNTCNFLDFNNHNQRISINENINESNNIVLSSSLQLNDKKSKTFLNTSDNLIKKHCSNYDSDTCYEIIISKNIENNLSKSDHNFNNDLSINEEAKEKRDKLFSNILKIYNKKSCKNISLDKKSKPQPAVTDILNIKTISKGENEISYTKIIISNNIEPKNVKLESYKKNHLNVISEENQSMLQLENFFRNNVKFQKFKESKLNMCSSKIKILSKKNIRKISSHNAEVRLCNKNKFNNNLCIKINKKSKQLKLNQENKIMTIDENILKYPNYSIKNKKKISNSKDIININKFENTLIKKGVQKQNCNDRNYFDNQEMNVSNITDFPISVDQILLDTSGLDEHLGDFDFLSSIKKNKYNSECYDDSDCNVKFEDHDSIECYINMKGSKENDSKIDKLSVESIISKTNENQKRNYLIETKNLQETIQSNNPHCLKKLPDFYNECITKIVKNKTKIDGNANIDISALNLFISDDNDHNLFVKHRSDFNSEIKTNTKQDKKIETKIVINLDDKINNLNNFTLSEKESKHNQIQFQKIIQPFKVQYSEIEKLQHIELEDMIISLCERYTSDDSVCNNLTMNEILSCDNSVLPMNEIVSLPNEFAIPSPDKSPTVTKNISSLLTFSSNETTVENDFNFKINLSALSDCTNSTKKSVSSNDFNSHSKICNRLSKYKSQNLSNEIVFCNRLVLKSAHQLIENKNNDFKVSDDFSKFNKSENDITYKKRKIQVSMALYNDLQLLLAKSVNVNTSTNIKNQISTIKQMQSIDLNNISSPIIFEKSIPSTQIQLEDNYDFLKNININLVDEIDDISDTSVFNSTVCSSSGDFKLRDINELLEKPEKLFETKKNSIDKLNEPQIPVSDKNLFNNPFSLNFISDKKRNYLTKENCINQFNVLNDLTVNNNLIKNHILDHSKQNYLYKNSYVDQSTCTPITNMNNSIPVTRNTLNYNMQQSCQQTNTYYPLIYSTLRPSTNQQFEIISQNGYSVTNNNSSFLRPHTISNTNEGSHKIVLASSIYSDFYADTGIEPKHTIFTLELPQFEILALHIPYIVNMQESSDIINKKIIKYKKMLLNKIFLVLKSIKTITPYRYKKYKNTLLKYNILTKDIWNFQLKIITLKQCICSFVNLSTNKNFNQILQAIINSFNPAEITKQCLYNLNDAIEFFHNLQQKGIVSKDADSKQPLLLEIEAMQNKNQFNMVIPMTKDQKQKFINQFAKFIYKKKYVQMLKYHSKMKITTSNFNTKSLLNHANIVNNEIENIKAIVRTLKKKQYDLNDYCLLFKTIYLHDCQQYHWTETHHNMS